LLHENTTHSHTKAAALKVSPTNDLQIVSTNSCVKAAAKAGLLVGYPQTVSTHSRVKAAARNHCRWC
jgi:hypothetical protein